MKPKGNTLNNKVENHFYLRKDILSYSETLCKILLSFIAVIGITLNLNAATKTWTGNVSNDWKTAGNWSPSGVPASGDDAAIPGSLTTYPLIDEAVTIKNITVNSAGSGAYLTITTGGALTATGIVTVNANGNLVQNGGTSALTGLLTVNASGVFNMSGGTMTATAGITNNGSVVQSGGNLFLAAKFTFNSGSTTSQSGGLIHLAANISTVPAYAFEISGGATINQTGGTMAVRDFKLNAATAVFNQSESTGASLVTIEHDYKNAGGTFNSTGGTITWTTSANSGAAATFNSGTNQFYNVTINGSNDPGFDDDDNAVILVRGNWTNNNTLSTLLTDKITTVTFNGTGNQYIGGTSTTTFRTFEVNSSASGGATGIILSGNMKVSTQLTFTKGAMDLGGYNLTLGTSVSATGTLSHSGLPSAGWLFGGSFTRWFASAVVADGSTSGLFPMGTGSLRWNFRPFYVSCPTTKPTTGGTITVSHTDAVTVSDVEFLDGIYPVFKRHDAYWSVSDANGLAGGTYNLRIGGTGFGVIQEVNDLRVVLVNGVVGTAGTNSGTIDNPVVNRTGITYAQLFPSSKGSNDFYLGSTDKDGSPLPIELLSFTADCSGGIVRLNWITATETNNDYFTVERSVDGITFENLATITGAGSSNSVKNYTYYDENSLTGISYYYRLKQTDFDGNYEYFDIVHADCNDINEFMVYPNPSPDGIIWFSGVNEGNIINIMNNSGQIVYTGNTSEVKGSVDLSSLSKGVYLLQMISGQNSVTKKIIIEP